MDFEKIVDSIAIANPANRMTLERLRDAEIRIRHDADAHGGETIEHLRAIIKSCGYRMQIIQQIDDFHDQQAEKAMREGRARYID